MNAIANSSVSTHVLSRVFFSIFKVKKKPAELRYFHYITDGKTFVIKFDFKDALWYELDGKITFKDKHTITSTSNLLEIPLNVYGMFFKSNYLIKLEHDQLSIKRSDHK